MSIPLLPTKHTTPGETVSVETSRQRMMDSPSPSLTSSKIAIVLATVLGMAMLVVVVHTTPEDASAAATSLSSQMCKDEGSRDTGGTCRNSDCYEWRKADCSKSGFLRKVLGGKCLCPEGQCAHFGQCLPRGVTPPVAKAPQCTVQTGETCRVLSCKHSGSSDAVECSGLSFGFSSGVSLGKCVCKAGYCVEGGKCVPKFVAPAVLDDKKIVCPVLASLYNAGLFKADAYGRVERLDVQAGIRDGLNADDQTGFGFGLTTAGYKEADVDETDYSILSVSAAKRMFAAKATKEEDPSQIRYLNIFEMAKNPDVMHQIGAAVRGGPIDPECPSWPCEKRYQDFVGKFADSKGRIYNSHLGNIACNVWKNGYHGPGGKITFFTVLLGMTGREFLALSGFMAAFGINDENGDRYIPERWFHHMEFHGTFPSDWVRPKATWGTPQVLHLMDIWREQGVCGVPNQIKTQTFLRKYFGQDSKEYVADVSKGVPCASEGGTCKCTGTVKGGVCYPGPAVTRTKPTCRYVDGSNYAMCGDDKFAKWGWGGEGQVQGLRNCNYDYSVGDKYCPL